MSDTTEIFLTSKQVKERYGNCTDMTIYRWLHDKDANFPKPVTIAKRRLWKRSDLESYERNLVRQQRQRGL